LARELIILPRFTRDYPNARKHPEFDVETLEYVFDVLISGEELPSGLREHRLDNRRAKWTGFTECHLGAVPAILRKRCRCERERGTRRFQCIDRD
jgi:mRNA-degrading endonuclease YafQ of YafQ-DinJ toxin-antitoxin module